MAVSLTKGQNVSLTKEAGPSGLSEIIVGLGWDERTTTGAAFDLDASAFVLDQSGRVINDQHFIFYNNLGLPDGSVRHHGDNRIGDVAGDDEVVDVHLSQLAPAVSKIVFAVTIHGAAEHGLNFGQVSKAYIRVQNGANSDELARFDLSEDASIDTAMVFGEVYRHAEEWKFRAIGQGSDGGLEVIARGMGVNL